MLVMIVREDLIMKLILLSIRRYGMLKRIIFINGMWIMV